MRIESGTSSSTLSFPVRAAMRFLLKTFPIMLSNVVALGLAARGLINFDETYAW